MSENKARAVRIHEFGGPEVLRIEEIAVPSPAKDEVRLRIRAIGLNRTEVTLRSGRSPAKPMLPTQIGFEAAGEIESIGENVTGFRPGDRVALIPSYGAARYGLYAELSVAPSRSLVRVPQTTGFVEAAASWVALGTAWCGLVAVGHLKRGEHVVISAASSSVGISAIQIANRLGAISIALTRSAAKAEALRQHGAAHVVVTSEQEIEQELRRITNGSGVHLVLDAVGGPAFSSLCKATRTAGRLLLYGALDREPTTLSPFDVFARGLTIGGFALPRLTEDDTLLEDLRQFVSTGLADRSLQPVIARTFDFDEIAAAHRFLESGEQIGKVVVRV